MNKSVLVLCTAAVLLAACGREEPPPPPTAPAIPAEPPPQPLPSEGVAPPADTPAMPPTTDVPPAPPAGDAPVAPQGQVPSPPAAEAGAPPATAAAGRGESVYKSACAVCHAPGVAGAPRLGDAADWGPRIAQGMDTLYSHSINGFQGAKGVMPPKGGNTALPDEDVRAAVDYMVSQAQ